MSGTRNDNWLDDELKRVVDGAAPEFDAEAWKRKYPQAYQAVLSRRQKDGQEVRTDRSWSVILLGPYVKFAAAAAVLLVASVIFFSDRPSGIMQAPPVPAESPTRLVSMMSLRTAYLTGGQKGLEQQLDTALDQLGPRPGRSSRLEILRDLEG